MKWIHPQLGNVAVLAAVAWIAATTGCRNRSGSATGNPFLSPDRVPPPATRSIAPGQAQPYYPGDPLPVMQSGAAPAAQAVAANGPATTSQPVRDIALSWTAPASAAARVTREGSSNAQPLGWSNESAVAIPQDGDALRFAQPAPQAALPASAAAAPPTNLAPMPSLSMSSPEVVPASFNAPVISNEPGPMATPIAAAPAPSVVTTGPWRSPQVNPPTTAPWNGLTLSSSTQPPITQPNSFDVRLRAVPSPPPEPVESTTPRIRLPGYPTPLPGSAAALPPSPYLAAASPFASGNVQTIQAAPLAPAPFAAPDNVTQASGSIGSSDGFRPRGSARSR